jgi:LacI family transcriptional regulator
MPPTPPVRPPLNVALIFPLRPGPWPDVVRGVYKYASRADPPWCPTLYTHEDPAVALAGNPDGVIAMIRTAEAAQKLAAWGGPVVDTAADLETHPFARVMLDGVALGRLAAEHLVRLKPRQFAFVGNQSALAGRVLREGFAARLRESGFACEVAPAGRFDDPYTEGPGARADAREWLTSLPAPLAVFASHDALAHRLVEVCHAAGLRVPDDVAVLGLLNDEFLCLTSCPQISSIRVPLARLGSEAARLLGEMILRNSRPAAPILLPGAEVVVRPSTDSSAVSDPELASALRYIREHSAKAIGVGDIAEASGLSRSSLERRFRAALGRGPLAELIRARVEHARRLLIETTSPVKEIARTAGFHDTRHLSITFRAKTGLSPVEYRARFRPA